MNKVEYWSIWLYGESKTLCSRHRTEAAARREAKACEKRGGMKHQILKVEFLPREQP